MPSRASESRTTWRARCLARLKSQRPHSATRSSRAWAPEGGHLINDNRLMTLILSAGPADLGALDASLLVVALAGGAPLDAALAPVDAAVANALSRAIERKDFRGGRDETL